MKNHAAFTFVEFLIVLILAAMVLGMGFPALQTFYERAQDERLQQQWLSSIAFASQAAQAYHLPISIAKQEAWSDGWSVFIDEDNSGEIKPTTRILNTVRFASKHHHLQWQSYPYYRDYVSFQPTFTLGEAEGVLSCCHANEKTAHWVIKLNRAARPRVLTQEESSAYAC